MLLPKGFPSNLLTVFDFFLSSGRTEKSSLVLSVCPREVEVEWIGDLNDVTMKTKKTGTGTTSQEK